MHLQMDNSKISTVCIHQTLSDVCDLEKLIWVFKMVMVCGHSGATGQFFVFSCVWYRHRI